MKKIINNMSGVTLLALTITLIVLLILTGITSSTILDKNDIIDKAFKAQDEAVVVEEMEKVNNAYSATTIRQTSKTTITDDDATNLQEELLKNVDGITVTVDIDEDGTKGFLVKFEKTKHYYFIENNEVRIATEEEFNDEITPVYAILYKKDTEYDLRFYKTCPTDDLPPFDENGWELLNDFKSGNSYQNISQTKFNVNQDLGLDNRPWASYINNITSVTFEEKIVPTLLHNWFNNCKNLTTINNIGRLHTYHVTDMSYMFYHCHSLENFNVSTFDTSKVTTMVDMFAHCRSVTELDLSHFDTSEVTDMYHMFLDCQSLQSLVLDNWNTSKVQNMDSMFAECTSLIKLDLKSFNTANVTDMRTMFSQSKQLQFIDMRNATFDNNPNSTRFFYLLDSTPLKIIVKAKPEADWIQDRINYPNITVVQADESKTE